MALAVNFFSSGKRLKLCNLVSIFMYLKLLYHTGTYVSPFDPLFSTTGGKDYDSID